MEQNHTGLDYYLGIHWLVDGGFGFTSYKQLRRLENILLDLHLTHILLCSTSATDSFSLSGRPRFLFSWGLTIHTVNIRDIQH